MTSIRNILRFLGLFAAGLALGLALFAPWNGLWARVLPSLLADVNAVTITYGAIEAAGPLSLTLSDVNARTPAGKINLTFRKVRLGFGLWPLLTVEADTGAILTAKITLGRSVQMSGSFDLSALNRTDLSGRVRIDGEVSFPAWGKPPTVGRLALSSTSLGLPAGLSAENVAADLDLHTQDLTLNSFAASKPVPITAKGSAKLEWENPESSTYNLEGSVKLGESENAFKRNGTLRDILAGL